MGYRSFLAVAALVPLAACSTGADLFGAAGAGGATTTGTPSSTSGLSTPQSSAVQSSASSAQGGAGPASTAAPASTGQGGMGTGGMGTGGSVGPCDHELCKTGMALTSGCNPCVTQICASDPYCCSTFWDGICVGYVGSVCQDECFPTGMGPCGMQYPQNPVCGQDGNQCSLAYNAQMASCQQLCWDGGGECLGAFNDQNNWQCQIDQGAPLTCTSMQFASAVCVCSLGCGNGPACVFPQLCMSGTCI